MLQFFSLNHDISWYHWLRSQLVSSGSDVSGCCCSVFSHWSVWWLSVINPFSFHHPTLVSCVCFFHMCDTVFLDFTCFIWIYMFLDFHLLFDGWAPVTFDPIRDQAGSESRWRVFHPYFNASVSKWMSFKQGWVYILYCFYIIYWLNIWSNP